MRFLEDERAIELGGLASPREDENESVLPDTETLIEVSNIGEIPAEKGRKANGEPRTPGFESNVSLPKNERNEDGGRLRRTSLFPETIYTINGSMPHPGRPHVWETETRKRYQFRGPGRFVQKRLLLERGSAVFLAVPDKRFRPFPIR